MAALILGAIVRTRSRALTLGAVLGFLASYAYLWFDDTSPLTPSSALRLALVIVVPAVFGMICGAVAAWLGLVLGRAVRARA